MKQQKLHFINLAIFILVVTLLIERIENQSNTCIPSISKWPRIDSDTEGATCVGVGDPCDTAYADDIYLPDNDCSVCNQGYIFDSTDGNTGRKCINPNAVGASCATNFAFNRVKSDPLVQCVPAAYLSSSCASNYKYTTGNPGNCELC
jgi:hypothetical protein